MAADARSTTAEGDRPFFGRRVVAAAFAMAVFGWGLGFYGPPVFLHAVVERTGWPLPWVSAAVTLHYLFGALVVSQLPRLHARFGVGRVAVAGAAVATLGVLGWALCRERWQLMAAALASGGGWVTMGAVAVNAAIAPWFVHTRPRALATAYNGASIGGVVFSPLWVALIGAFGFAGAALSVGVVATAAMALLSATVFGVTPQRIGQHADGGAADAAPLAPVDEPAVAPAPGAALWRSRAFVTLALGMAIGLFAQVGLLAHLFGLLVPVLGAQQAGWAMGLATACGMGGRSAVARALSPQADRRRVAATCYAVQIAGVLLLLAPAAVSSPTLTIALIVLAVALFGSGIGNSSSLPPLIAQAEFARADVQRVVAAIVAGAQATYAFAPALLATLLVADGGPPRIGHGSAALLLAVAALMALAIACFLAGQRR